MIEVKFKPGQKVRCIKMEGEYSNKLQVGEVYTVANPKEHKNPHSRNNLTWDHIIENERMIIVEENNALNCYGMHCFEPIIPLEYYDVV